MKNPLESNPIAVFNAQEDKVQAVIQKFHDEIQDEQRSIRCYEVDIERNDRTRDDHLLAGKTKEAEELASRNAQLKSIVKASERRIDLLQQAVAKSRAAELIELGARIVTDEQTIISKKIGMLEEMRHGYEEAINEFRSYLQELSEIYRRCTQALAKSGRGSEISSFPRSRGYAPENHLPKLPPALEMHPDVPSSMFFKRPGIDWAQQFGTGNGGLEMTVIEEAGEIGGVTVH